jgi:hypothetical protein
MERWEHYRDSGAGLGVRGFGGTEADALVRCHAPTEDPTPQSWISDPEIGQ